LQVITQQCLLQWAYRLWIPPWGIFIFNMIYPQGVSVKRIIPLSAAGDRTTVGPAAPWGGRFAPRSPLGLGASSRGAKSSHSRQSFSPSRPPGGIRSLLPAPHEPLWLRLGEQNLHIPDAGFHPSDRPAASALCSPLPARPWGFVPGSKIFTLPTPVFTLPAARRPPLFAPRSPLGLVAPSRGAKSSHNFRPLSAVSPANRPVPLLPVPR